MKKTIAFLLATAMMCCSLTVTSLAASNTTSGSSSGVSTSTNAAKETYKVTASLLNVRSGPSTEDKNIGSLSKDETVIGTVSNGWLSFTYNGKAAFCSVEYLTQVVAASTASKTYTVTASELYVRSGPDTKNSKLGSLTKGETVTGTVSSGWLSFTYNGQTAYCNASYIK